MYKGNSTQASKSFDLFLFCLSFFTKWGMPDKRQEYRTDADVTSTDKQLSIR